MRKLLTVCAILLSLSASAQWQLTGSRVRYVNGIGIPTRDTSAMTPADSSQILIRPADSALYVRYKRAWQKVGAGGGGISGSGTTNYIPKFTSSSAIGNSQIFDNGTNVGIGTTSPGNKVDIFTTNRTALNTVGSGLNVNYNGSTTGEFATIGFSWASSLGNISTQWGIGMVGTNFSAGTAALNLFTNGAERMRIDASGNVGIGTTSPAYKLDISGNVHTNNTIYIDNGQYLSFQRNTGGLQLQTLGIPSGTDNVRLLTSADFDLVNGALSSLLKVTSNGNVGIGYTSPAAKLSVNGRTLINTNTDNGVDALQVSGSMNVSALATTNNLSVTTNATVGGTLRVTGTTTLGTTNTGPITASSIDAGTGNGSFGNVYSGGIVQMLGVNVKYRNISATYTATTSDDYFINITSGTFTLNLPTAATPYGQVYVIKNSGTGTVTVDPNGSQTIDGATTFTMNVQNGSITIIGDGSNWKIVSKYL